MDNLLFNAVSLCLLRQKSIICWRLVVFALPLPVTCHAAIQKLAISVLTRSKRPISVLGAAV